MGNKKIDTSKIEKMLKEYACAETDIIYYTHQIEQLKVIMSATENALEEDTRDQLSAKNDALRQKLEMKVRNTLATYELVNELIDSLDDPKLKHVIKLYYGKKRTTLSDIADELGYSLESIKSYKKQALVYMQGRLNARRFDLSTIDATKNGTTWKK